MEAIGKVVMMEDTATDYVEADNHHDDALMLAIIIIWVSFCRAGEMAVSCHIFSKSRAFV